MKIALCGNPNVGKTTLFNRLTRSDEPVGNWHGVTVDVRTKRMDRDNTLSDLPGAYSLTALSPEERITGDSILNGDFDVIAYVAEVNNLRRNLYLFTQLMEADKHAVLIVNMMDEARGKVDLDLLSSRLGVPVVGTSDRRENPKRAITAAAKEACGVKPKRPGYLNDPRIKAAADKIRNNAAGKAVDAGFAALKIMECDAYVMDKLGIKAAECAGCDGCGACASDRSGLPSRLRYAYIDEVLKGVIEKQRDNAKTDRADRIILGKAALPIFLAIMAAVFVITFELGKPLSDLLVRLTERASDLRDLDMPDWAIALLCDGVLSGVGGVLAFLPQVVLLFLLTAILQDSGYMSRVAFITDDFFKKFGLNGRAAFSVVLGLGCSATAVLTTRGIADVGAKRRAAFATPFCPCSARLAVFTALAAYFGLSGFAVAAMYIVGFAAALAVLKIMTLFRPDKDTGDEFIMEMPPYRLPQPKRIVCVVWKNVISFVARVGSVVLCVSVIMWVLCNFSVAEGFTGGGENSIMSTFAGLIAPLFAPLGFGNWQAVTALISGVAAKETVISVINGLGGASVVLGGKTEAVSFMIFTCLYVPCIATVSVIAKENGIKSALLSILVHTAVAYITALVYYRSALGYNADKAVFFTVWTVIAAAVAAVIITLKIKRAKARRRKLA